MIDEASFVPKAFKRGLVNCLLHRAWRLCSDYVLLHKEIEYIKDMLASNGYPATFLDSCTQKSLNKKNSVVPELVSPLGPEKKQVFLSYLIVDY